MYAKRYFPTRLKELRDAIGVSQDEIAGALGVSRSTIGYYEKGDRTPDIDMLDRIHELTGCSIEYLLGYSENMKPDYADIGLMTRLTDNSIRNLGEYDFYSGEINYLLEHPLFPRVLKAMQHYLSVFGATDGDYPLDMDDKGYLKFVIAQTMWKIVDDYDASVEKVPLSSIDWSTFDVEIAKDYRKAHERIEKALDAYKEMKDEREKQAETVWQKREEETKERMKVDPIFRFRERMMRTEEWVLEQDGLSSDNSILSETKNLSDKKPR